MIGFLSLAAIFTVLIVGLAFAVVYIARMGRCAEGEDHYVCFREWLKAATPLVALIAAFVAAAGGWIALQNLSEIQKSRLEQAANVERSRIATIMKEKEAFLKVYRSEFLQVFVSELRRPMPAEMPVIKIQERLEGLKNVRIQDEIWLSSQYAVGPASNEIGRARHAFDKVTADLVRALTDVIALYADNKNRISAEWATTKVTYAVSFYANDFKRVCDAYWDALDKEMIRLRADIADLDRRAFDR